MIQECRCNACGEVLSGPGVSRCPHCGVRLQGVKTVRAEPHKPFKNPGMTEAAAAVFAAFVLPLLSLPLATMVVRNAREQNVRRVGGIAVALHGLIFFGVVLAASIASGLDPYSVITVLAFLALPVAIVAARKAKGRVTKIVGWIGVLFLILLLGASVMVGAMMAILKP